MVVISMLVLAFLYKLCNVNGFLHFPSIKTHSIRPMQVGGIDSLSVEAPLSSVAPMVGAHDDESNTPLRQMFISCIKCGVSYVIQRNRIMPKKDAVKCSICSFEWTPEATKVYTAGNIFSKMQRITEDNINDFKRWRESGGQGRIQYDRYAIFIRNLPQSYTHREILELFAEYGVVGGNIAKDSETGRSKGFGFVYFLTPEDAEQAIEDMNGFYVEPDRQLEVSKSLPKERR